MAGAEHINGTAIALALDADGPLCGIIFCGPSGCGKSSLGLILIDQCRYGRTALVGDDRVELATTANTRQLVSIAAIRGLIEVRGIGPVPVRCVHHARFVAQFAFVSDRPERFWTGCDLSQQTIAHVPLWDTVPLGVQASRVRAICRSLLSGQMR